MAEKKKNDEQIPAPAPEEEPVMPALDPHAAPVPKVAPPPAPGPKPPAAPVPGGLMGRAKPAPAPVSALASATGTSALVLAALKAAYGWTERTRLTRAEFVRLRDEWLKRPADEV